MKGYCMKCKAQREMVNAVNTKTSRGTLMAKGKCVKCGTTICKIGVKA